MHRPLVLASLSLTAVLGACASGGPSAAAAGAALPTRIEPDAEELRRDLFAFAADSFRGRETGTPDADRAAAFLVRRLQSMGLEPAGDSGYYQRVPLRRSRTTLKEATVTSPDGKRSLALGRDIAFLTALGPGALTRLTADGDVVFASYGLTDAAMGRNDWDGLDVKGKVVVIAGTIPPGLDSAKKRQLENPQMLFGRIGAAIGRQPAGIVLLLPDSVFQLAAGQFSGNQVELALKPVAATARTFPMVAVARLTSSNGLLPSDWPNADKARALAGTRFSASIDVASREFNGYNVVGIVRGSDPAFNRTYVAYGAHYDHIGIQPAVNGDSIANGADDDGSGTVTLLSIARAWMQGPRPKRSALFVWHIGEEKGLLGSQLFTERPTVPLDSIVAQLNADMIGRNGDDSLYVVGPAAAPKGQSSVLGAVVDSVNAALPRKFTFDREWDTPTHPEQIYYRSDHYNYAKKGIPIVFLTTGLHKEYHQVSDEPQLINYPKMARIGGLMYRTGVVLGNRTSRPIPTAVQ